MEHFVAVGSSVWSLGNSTKAIEVELSLEGCKLDADERTKGNVFASSVLVGNLHNAKTNQI